MEREEKVALLHVSVMHAVARGALHIASGKKKSMC